MSNLFLPQWNGDSLHSASGCIEYFLFCGGLFSVLIQPSENSCEASHTGLLFLCTEVWFLLAGFTHFSAQLSGVMQKVECCLHCIISCVCILCSSVGKTNPNAWGLQNIVGFVVGRVCSLKFDTEFRMLDWSCLNSQIKQNILPAGVWNGNSMGLE